jgi:hypothetical protein
MGNIKNSKEKLMTLTLNDAGYYRVDLRENSKLKIAAVHRIVAKAFIKNLNNYPVVNHKDSNRLNNKVENLEWCTYSWNNRHACLFGNAPIGIDKPNSILKDSDISTIKDMLESGVRNSDIARCFGVNDGAISEIRLGKTWMHIDDRVFEVAGKNPVNKKLCAEDIPKIRALFVKGKKDCDIGRIYNVARGTINQIRQGKTWTNY